MFTHYFKTDSGIKEESSEIDSIEVRRSINENMARIASYHGPGPVIWIATVEQIEEQYAIPKLALTARELSAKIKNNVGIFQKSKSAEPNCVALNDAISDTRKLLKLLTHTLSECQHGESLNSGAE